MQMKKSNNRISLTIKFSNYIKKNDKLNQRLDKQTKKLNGVKMRLGMMMID